MPSGETMPNKPFAEIEELVGETKLTVDGLHVEAGKVEEFARSLDDDKSIYRDGSGTDEDGSDDVLAPLTFTRTAFFPRYRPDDMPDYGHEFGATMDFDIGFDLQYTMHAKQEYEFERPIEVGDHLDGRTTLVDAFQRGGDERTMTFVVFETEYRDSDGELVLTERATNVEVVPGEETAETEETDA